MDRKTIIGLGLIGVILVGFSFLHRPSEAEIERQKAQQEVSAGKEKEQEKIAETPVYEEENKNNLVALLDENGNPVKDSLGNDILVQDSLKKAVPTTNVLDTKDNSAEKTFFLENEKLKIVFTNKGGGVKSVFLKTHQTYKDYILNSDSEEITPLQLFDEETATNGLSFQMGDRSIFTRKLDFSLSHQSDNAISFVLNLGGGKTIEQIYTLVPDKYHIGYEIKTQGFNEGEISPNNIYLDWEMEMLSTEKLLSEQRRTSTVFFKEKGGSYDYLSEMSDDQVDADTDIDWVAFKQSYFSSILMPRNAFVKDGTNFEIQDIANNPAKDTTHIKAYSALINLGIQNANNSGTTIDWYFGPNDYDLLKSYDNGIEDLLNYGWGLFRWINIYAIQPLFVWLANMGMNIGIAILVLTIIVKLILTPIQWKMYLSSAKMRILKPEIEAINKKYPKKDQAMDKQMEMMSLYRETGSSPLAGCFPMLIQMPILFAVFRFFPSTFSLRQQSFLWADDLSSYDSILDLGFNIPLYGSHISLFTLLMAGTTLIYTVLNSSNQMQPSQPGMPNMKIIMYLFPIMMIFFFNNYASGLSYYYFISTLMSILTMVAIKNFFVDEEKLKLKMANRQESAKKNGAKKGKSKFQQRLEEMQKLQQERAKNKR